MFGKLLKYDFRSMCKQFAFIWPAALALAGINHFTMNAMTTVSGDGAFGFSSVGTTTAAIAMLIYVAILMAMFIAALVFTIQRFYKGLLGDEGYLMHTLPVRPWQLIGSKLLCAVVTTFLSVVVAVLSILIIFPWGREDFQEIFRALGYLFSHWNIQATHSILGLAEFILMMLTSFAAGYLQLYLAMALGHLFNKNRVAFSVIFFIAINAAVSALGNIIQPPLGDIISPMLDNLRGMAAFHAGIWCLIAGELVLSAVYFAGTEFILRRKLNLE